MFEALQLILLITCLLVVDLHPVKDEVDPIKAMIHPQLLEGDILIRQPPLTLPFKLRNAVPNDYYLWPNGVIPYILDDSISSSLKDLIQKAMSRIEKHTCIRFREKTNDDHYYTRIFRGDGCYASIGRDMDWAEQLVSLGQGCEYIGTVTHELMHVIGYYHEHNRHDRDDFLNIYWDNIRSDSVQEFEKLLPTEERIFTPFDYNSIMLYGPRAFSKDGSAITMSPKLDGFYLIEVFQKPGLTLVDAESINKLYKC